jgi:hypothetical protein
MELDPKDYDVVKLLTKLKYNHEIYPKELLTPRRQIYIQRVAEIGLGLGVSSGLKTTVKSGNRSLSTIAGGLIETLLILAIVVEAGAAIYIYREEISALLQSRLVQTKVEAVTPVPETALSPNLPEAILTEPPEVTTTPLASETPTGTIVASVAANDNTSNNTGIQGNSTPGPNGNNGNQYGLTPKPDRTREPGGGGNDNNNDNGKDKNKDK